MERQAALAVAKAELGRAGLAGDDDRQVDEVVRVADEDDVAGGLAHVLEVAPRHVQLRISFGLNGRTTVPSGPTISRTICGWYSLPPLASAA